MAEEIATVTRALNTVQTVGAARALAGAALTYAGTEVYPVLDAADLPSDLSKSLRKSLDGARVSVETNMGRMSSAGDTWPVDASTWVPLRQSITQLYIESSGVQGAASYVPRTTFGQILAEQASSVAQSVGQGVAATANIVGNVAGGALGGAIGGIGIYGLLAIAAVVFILLRARSTV